MRADDIRPYKEKRCTTQDLAFHTKTFKKHTTKRACFVGADIIRPQRNPLSMPPSLHERTRGCLRTGSLFAWYRKEDSFSPTVRADDIRPYKEKRCTTQDLAFHTKTFKKHTTKRACFVGADIIRPQRNPLSMPPSLHERTRACLRTGSLFACPRCPGGKAC